MASRSPSITMKTNHAEIGLTFVVLVAFVSSFFLPVNLPGGSPETAKTGLAIAVDLLWNPMYGFLTTPALLPNLTVVAGVVLLRREMWIPARTVGFFGLTIALVTPFAADYDDVMSVGIGYYVWLFSIALVFVAGVMRRK